MTFPSQTSISAGTQLQLKISGFINPPTTQPSNSISVQIEDSFYYQINSSPPTVTITTTIPATLQSVNLT